MSYIRSVSYTHLDVYKRQVLPKSKGITTDSTVHVIYTQSPNETMNDHNIPDNLQANVIEVLKNIKKSLLPVINRETATL